MEELILFQRTKLLEVAKEVIPHITEEDILQPFDYPALENNANFRYEEGILSGLLSARAILESKEGSLLS